MLNKFMLSVALLTTCFISIPSVKATEEEVRKENTRPPRKRVLEQQCPESPMKGGVVNNEYWQRKVAKHPDLYEFKNGELFIDHKRFLAQTNKKPKKQ